MTKQLSVLGLGYLISALISLSSITYLAERFPESLLTFSIFTVFATVSIFDAGFSRIYLNLVAKNNAKADLLYLQFIEIAYIGLSFFVLTMCFFYFDFSLYSSPILLISIVLSSILLLNLTRILLEGIGVYLLVATTRVMQSFFLSILAFCIPYSLEYYLIPLLLIILLYHCLVWCYVYPLLFCKQIRFIDLFRSYFRIFNFHKLLIAIKRLYIENKPLIINSFLVSAVIVVTNLGDRFLLAKVVAPYKLISYLSLQEILSKGLAISTLLSTILYRDLTKLISKFADINIARTSSVVRMQLFSKIKAFTVLYLLFFFVSIFYIHFYMSNVRSDFSILSIALLSLGILLDGIAGIMCIYLESLSFYSLRSKLFSMFGICNVFFLLYFINSFPLPLSVSFYWLSKGIIEIFLLFLFCYRRFFMRCID